MSTTMLGFLVTVVVASSSLENLPPAFGVFYQVIGTAHFFGCTFDVLGGTWTKTRNCFDNFASSTLGPATFSPSRNTYLWVGYNEETHEQPFAYSIQIGGSVRPFPSGASDTNRIDWRGLLALNDTNRGLLAVDLNGTIVSIASGTRVAYVPQLNATTSSTGWFTHITAATNMGFAWLSHGALVMRLDVATWECSTFTLPHLSLKQQQQHVMAISVPPGDTDGGLFVLAAATAAVDDHKTPFNLYRLNSVKGVWQQVGQFTPPPEGSVVMAAALDGNGEWVVLDTSQGFMVANQSSVVWMSMPGAVNENSVGSFDFL